MHDYFGLPSSRTGGKWFPADLGVGAAPDHGALAVTVTPLQHHLRQSR